MYDTGDQCFKIRVNPDGSTSWTATRPVFRVGLNLRTALTVTGQTRIEPVDPLEPANPWGGFKWTDSAINIEFNITNGSATVQILTCHLTNKFQWTYH